MAGAADWGGGRLQALLGIEIPILLAPMAGATTPALTAAVSNAGGLGGHGATTFAPEKLKDEIAAMRAATNRPIHLNFFAHAEPPADGEAGPAMRTMLQTLWNDAGLGALPPAESAWPSFHEGQLAVIGAMRPQVVSFHFGLPGQKLVDRVKAAGCQVLCSATAPAEAVELEKRGVDAVIAQGFEAGGHSGIYLSDPMQGAMTTMALVPQVADAVGLPVIAAGGIMDGRGIAAALMLGAAGVQIGTAFLSCPEASVSGAHRAALLEARAKGTPTVLTKGISGRPARGLRNRLLAQVKALENEAAPFPMQNALTRSLGSAGDPELTVMWAGGGAALSRAMPAAELVAMLVAETEAVLARYA
ncbi:MAG: nitronate monooxygenase family protein [Proteobacteria bacterium]|nr:nitronate monooxygenase family protein [Pseudomonadota bacterium]